MENMDTDVRMYLRLVSLRLRFTSPLSSNSRFLRFLKEEA